MVIYRAVALGDNVSINFVIQRNTCFVIKSSVLNFLVKIIFKKVGDYSLHKYQTGKKNLQTELQ